MSFYRFVHAVVLSVFKLLFRVRVHGRKNVPKRGVYIVAPSHRSVFDIPFAAFTTRRRIRFMAKRELFSSKFGRWLFNKLGAISVDRTGTDRAALRETQAALEAGEPVGIFPEGTRRNGPVLGELYDGVTYMAMKMGVPVLPVGIGGSEEILASGKVIPKLHKVVIVIGEPITPTPSTGVRRRSEVQALTDELRTRLQECFDAARTAAGESVPLVSEGRESE
jgi:1-acyl-sn-glycerol-3-phosphate acyltransferase